MKKPKQLIFFEQLPVFLKIKEELESLFKDKTIKNAIRLSLFLLFLIFILTAVFWMKLPPETPLFYSRPWGKDQLAKKEWFLILPLICFLSAIFNFRLSSMFLKKEPLLAQMLSWTTVILFLLANITIIRILFIIL